MEVSVNQNMKNPPLNVGVIVPPDEHYKPVLYSHNKATQDFKKINQDVYQSRKKAKRLDERKTPKSVLWTLGIAVATLAFVLIKKCFHKA